jgi:hypothetical protein
MQKIRLLQPPPTLSMLARCWRSQFRQCAHFENHLNTSYHQANTAINGKNVAKASSLLHTTLSTESHKFTIFSKFVINYKFRYLRTNLIEIHTKQ